MSERKLRVLLVDDEPSIIKTVGKRLELEGFEVLVATDGEEALAKAQTGHPDAIVLDLMLPKLSGFDVCAKLKQDQQSTDIPIITIFSGKASPEDATRCRQLGAAAYVPKGKGAAPLVEQLRLLFRQLESSKPDEHLG